MTEKELKPYLDKIVIIQWLDDEKIKGFLTIERNDKAYDKDGRHFYTLYEYGLPVNKPYWFHPEDVKGIELIGDSDEAFTRSKFKYKTFRT